MKTKTKDILKILFPIIVIGQLAYLINMQSKDKGFQCVAVKTRMVCREIKIKM